MRQKAIRRDGPPQRNKMFKTYRRMAGQQPMLLDFVSKEGKVCKLNLTKRMLLGQSYTNPEHQKELERYLEHTFKKIAENISGKDVVEAEA